MRENRNGRISKVSWGRFVPQQADVLTSELEAYRRLLTPVIEKICRFWMITNGRNDGFSVEWDDITLQDEVELAKARLYRAQSERIEQELKSVE